MLVGCLAVAVQFLGGPVRSGAVFLLRPAAHAQTEHDLPDSYTPLHKGGIDASSGLYIRDDEDLVLRGTPPIVYRRTYLSGYHVQRELGVGTTHNGELYLIGDPERFQWAELILPNGARIRFVRVSPGTSYTNALFEHHDSDTAFRGARLGWTGGLWALRLADGTLLTFLGCGGTSRACSLLSVRDPDGHLLRCARDASGRLLRMESGDRWVAFDYDARARITKARDSERREVSYAYDERGRLVRVEASDGTVRRYGYTDRDEMAIIEDPAIHIENTYDSAGKVVRQVNRFPGDPEPLIWEFDYRTDGRRIISTDMRVSDGTARALTFDHDRRVTSETWRWSDAPAVSFTYDRNALDGTTRVTVICPDRTGRPLRHSSFARPGELEWIKWDLLQTGCSWRRWRRPRTDAVVTSN